MQVLVRPGGRTTTLRAALTGRARSRPACPVPVPDERVAADGTIDAGCRMRHIWTPGWPVVSPKVPGSSCVGEPTQRLLTR
jgi:hypothetical protein